MTKIMLVEDDKSLREIYGVRLQAEGYEIKSAGDGEEALAMAIKEKPDLILSDVMMPKISGFDMLDILRATPETRDIKVIMMTALSSEDQRARGETLGANKYLVKSQVGIEDVVRSIHELLADAPINTLPTTPAPAPAPINPPVVQQPTAQPPIIIPAPAEIQEPVIIPTPLVPVATEPVSIPQPTAPFSTPAPASMMDNMNPAPQFTSPVEQTSMQAPVQPTQMAAPQYMPAAPAEPAITQIPDTAEMINQQIDTAENTPPTPQI
jgi:CheY-like chemotaxis protein